MKDNIKEVFSKLRDFGESLRRNRFLRGIGITYQVTWNLVLLFLIIGLLSTIFVGGVAAGYFASLVKDEPLRTYEDMKKDIYNYEEISEVYFANDVLLGELPTELERREVKLNEVSEHVINALIATEDEYFHEHEGVVPKAILRATFQEFANSSVQTGGSTLTQQLVKNQILTSEVSFDRKATEILLAMRLEQFFEKEEILEAYLNVATFGRNASGRNIAGIQAAAQGIFGVDAKDLNLPQAAYIAGLPQSPFGYTPFTGSGEVKENLEPGLNRMKTVLRRMRDAGYINEQEYERALAYDIRENLTSPKPSSIEEYPLVTFETERRATDILATIMMEDDGIDLSKLDDEELLTMKTRYRDRAARDLRRNGYKIHTTIDKDIFDAMQEASQDNRLFGPDRDGEQEEMASMLIENKTGAILGFVGGRDTSQEYNIATQARRSNGSTMKPLLAYGPAMEIGNVQPGHIIPDVPTFYTGTSTQVNNFNRQHRGLITVRDALKYSQNTVAVKSFRLAPHELRRGTLEKFGITTLIDGEPFESAALGALEHQITIEQNTAAYAMFANEGQFIDSYFIERIETTDGQVIYQHESEPVEVFTPQTSYLMIDMMRDVLRSGTATYVPSRLKFNADWAGKTGTSNNFHDAWFVATNPNVTLSVWVGYRTPKSIETRPVGGLSYGQRTQQMWANIANAAYDVRPELMAPENRFQMPGGIVRKEICGISGLLPSKLCREAGLVSSDLFNAKYVPTKVDDSLQEAKYVILGGEPYLALDSTPSEFTFDGVMIKEDYFKDVDLSEYVPDHWKNIVPDRQAEENGKVPGNVSGVTINGNTLSWSEHGERDIVGYRVYRAANGTDKFELYANVVERDNTSTKVGSGKYAYYVIAVDVAGQESTSTNIVSQDGWSPEEEEKEEPNEEKPKKPKPKPERDQNGNGNGNGDRPNPAPRDDDDDELDVLEGV
ncbi:transglycosylase domain-containing protein [Bacillus alkalicellulosilyticus]|uniref:transglycosylase domain-containing protein n=1 Tax=Alkalihalobacterium alkalicellulosilyticum TaxID=1912214 RepID=UPI0009962920|nr:transglycosylase domain-containing protein [Bacillus alkalicellulosilyticus]